MKEDELERLFVKFLDDLIMNQAYAKSEYLRGIRKLGFSFGCLYDVFLKCDDECELLNS